ncbi:MAG: 3-hydroxyacyl-[acyl-carrier-protein] dehydratase FabZ [Gammaproteobacteria bacterium RIFCSPHIGHO2_12_FULL_43_28]|nr:MAG: 3-hydroxyacyl-[acyl-carrier-protein] dehydratase FabZ [Gammaproteobacteria bacterium RIFCSPHIGHO2_12_FULL_43_28]
MDIHEILEYLPHRYPFLLIDRVLALDLWKSVTAIKNVTMNESFFAGHFPERPVMPGVLVLESMAQAAAVLAYKSKNTKPSDGSLYYFAGIDNARFKRVVEPGDQLRLEIKVTGNKLNVWKMQGSAYVGDELACIADFISASK